MKNCPVSDICPDYKTGNNKPPNHHVRSIVPCEEFLKGTCHIAALIQWKVEGSKGISCRLDKHKEDKND